MNLFTRVKRFFTRTLPSKVNEYRESRGTKRSYNRKSNDTGNLSVPSAKTFGGSENEKRHTKGLQDGSVYRRGKYVDLNKIPFHRYSAKQLMTILKNNHPDMSQAVWNFKIIGNSGYVIKVVKKDGKTEHESGQKLVDDFLRRLSFYDTGRFEKSRSLDKIIDQLFDYALLRGALALEMVLDTKYEDVLYMVAVDPDTIDFKVEGGRIIPYQDKVKLDIPTFFHEGVDETDTDPFGTTPFLSVINTLAFQLEVLQDIKAVVHNQGYGKYDIKIIEEVLLKRMPISIRNNEQKKQEWLNARLQEVIEQYSKLDPDAAFVHFDSVEADMLESGNAMIDPQKLMGVIDTQIMGALKQYSTLMGRRSQGQTEQYAKMEIKIFMKSVKRVRDMIESVLSRAFTKLLHIHGMQGYVYFKFKDTEIRTDLEQVNFEQIKISNEAMKRDQGWITQDQASENVTGQKAVGKPDKEMLGKKQPKGALDERQPDDPQSSDNPRNA